MDSSCKGTMQLYSRYGVAMMGLAWYAGGLARRGNSASTLASASASNLVHLASSSVG